MHTYKSIIVKGDTSSIVGVKPGDFNTYNYNATLFSNDTDLMLSTNPYYQWFSAIDSCQVLVENVSDTNITAQFLYMLRNGTTDVVTRWVDLNNLASDSETAKGYFIALNSTNFNETLTRTYVGVSREVGHLYGGFVNGTYVWWHN